jgi:hypothetical protein
MNKIYNSKLNKEYLRSIDKTERAVFFTLAHFLNEMNALNKLLFWVSITPSFNNKAENLGRLTYQFMFIRYFAGKLHEGHELLSKSFYGSGISKEYAQNMNDEATTALKNIHKYFSKENMINKIRNSLAFHYNPQKLDGGFINAPDDLDIYIEQTGNSNNLFYFGEVVAGRALLSESGNLNDKSENPYQKLIHEIFEVGRWFSTVVNHILRRFIEKHKEKIWDGVATEVEFENLVSVLDVHIPWFADMSKVEEGMDGQ